MQLEKHSHIHTLQQPLPTSMCWLLTAILHTATHFAHNSMVCERLISVEVDTQTVKKEPRHFVRQFIHVSFFI
jgi:hypothetical protein